MTKLFPTDGFSYCYRCKWHTKGWVEEAGGKLGVRCTQCGCIKSAWMEKERKDTNDHR